MERLLDRDVEDILGVAAIVMIFQRVFYAAGLLASRFFFDARPILINAASFRSKFLTGFHAKKSFNTVAASLTQIQARAKTLSSWLLSAP